MVRRPGAGELHLAFPHHGAGSYELALIAFDVLAVDQMGNIQYHLAAFSQPAAYLFIQGQEEPVHLETDRAGARLALAGAGRALAQAGEILPSRALDRHLPFALATAATVDHDLQVHLGLAAQFVDIAEELALV
jgi:hypothetical protein